MSIQFSPQQMECEPCGFSEPNKPFSCTFCGVKFSIKSHLITHESSHTVPTECVKLEVGQFTEHETSRTIATQTQFSDLFSSDQTLVLKIEGEDQTINQSAHPFSCTYCGAKFSVKSHLISHETFHLKSADFQKPEFF